MEIPPPELTLRYFFSELSARYEILIVLALIKALHTGVIWKFEDLTDCQHTTDD